MRIIDKLKKILLNLKRRRMIMKCKNEDLILLEEVYASLGKEKFIRLYELMNNYCISELGLRDSHNCKRTPLDDADDFCIKCITDELENLLDK